MDGISCSSSFMCQQVSPVCVHVCTTHKNVNKTRLRCDLLLWHVACEPPQQERLQAASSAALADFLELNYITLNKANTCDLSGRATVLLRSGSCF